MRRTAVAREGRGLAVRVCGALALTLSLTTALFRLGQTLLSLKGTMRKCAPDELARQAGSPKRGRVMPGTLLKMYEGPVSWAPGGVLRAPRREAEGVTLPPKIGDAERLERGLRPVRLYG